MSDMPPPPPDYSAPPPVPPPVPPPPPGGDAYSNPQAVTGWANLGIGGSVELASPGARLGARILDSIIMLAVIVILFLMASAAVGGVAADDTVSDEEAAALFAGALLFGLVTLAIGVLYEVTMIAVKGQTLGKMATSIKVVRADNGHIPGWGKSISRWIIPAVLFIIPLIGWVLSILVYLSLTWDRARQGWHDKAAATLVVKA